MCVGGCACVGGRLWVWDEVSSVSGVGVACERMGVDVHGWAWVGVRRWDKNSAQNRPQNRPKITLKIVPKLSPKSLQNHSKNIPKITPKLSQNLLKIGPKSSSKLSQNRFKIGIGCGRARIGVGGPPASPQAIYFVIEF
jgi:hypothetical protein